MFPHWNLENSLTHWFDHKILCSHNWTMVVPLKRVCQIVNIQIYIRQSMLGDLVVVFNWYTGKYQGLSDCNHTNMYLSGKPHSTPFGLANEPLYMILMEEFTTTSEMISKITMLFSLI